MATLDRMADLIFVIPAGNSFWAAEMYEPLLIGIVFPFLSFSPWQLKGTPKVLSLGRKLSTLWKSEQLDAGNILCKFCAFCRRMESMPRDAVRRMLYFQSET